MMYFIGESEHECGVKTSFNFHEAYTEKSLYLVGIALCQPNQFQVLMRQSYAIGVCLKLRRMEF